MSARAAAPVDVAIVGGGMVGASLAVGIADTKLCVVLVEAVPLEAASQPSFDDRTTALGNGSRRIFETLGVWPHLSAQAGPVREIRVSDAGRFGAARLCAAEQGLEALGYVVSNRQIGAALWRELAQRPRILVRNPARVLEVRLENAGARLAVHSENPGAGAGTQAGAAEREEITARGVVAADGAQSLVPAAAGIAALVEDYRQVAVVVHPATHPPASARAYERFTPARPPPVLPPAARRHT